MWESAACRAPQLGPERRQGAINDALEAREVPAGLLGDRLALLGTVGVLEASVRVVDKAKLVGFVQVDGWRQGELAQRALDPQMRKRLRIWLGRQAHVALRRAH